jgi:acyl-phosphate glycerol 3-phosphate acyltransferase
MDLLLILLAYLLGSINFPILVGRLKGLDIRVLDIAGTSGVFRQFGKVWGSGVFLLEVGKGVLAAWVVGLGSLWTLPLGAAAVVIGHIWPVFFGFRGGGGLAAAFGFALGAFPQQALIALLVTGVMVGVYFAIFKRDRFTGIGSLPFGAIFGVLYLLIALLARPTAFYSVLAMGLVMGLRGVLVLSGRWWQK